jgi:hypothetical protein
VKHDEEFFEYDGSRAKKLEKEFSFEDTRPLSPHSKVLWTVAKRGRGRPRKPASEKARRILISIEPSLLALIEQFIAANGLDRSKLFALSAQAFMAANDSHCQVTAKHNVRTKPHRPVGHANER